MTKKIIKLVAGAGALGVLGLVALPITAYAITGNVDLNVVVDSTIGLNCSNGGNFTQNVANNTTNKALQVQCVVTTNNAAGYTLGFKDSDTTTSLVSGTNSIPTTAGALASTSSMWGYLGSTNAGSTLTAIPASSGSAISMANTSTPSAVSGDTYNAYFGVGVSAAQASGTYTDTLTFTATAN